MIIYSSIVHFALSICIITPTLLLLVIYQDTGMVATEGNGIHGASAMVEKLAGVLVFALVLLVVAPTLQLAARGHCAAVLPARLHGPRPGP